jgi:hypothetical protein
MTSATLTTLLVLAVTAAASPFSLVSFSLVLATDRGPRNGVAFIVGWIVTVWLIGVAASVFGAEASPRSSNAVGKWTLAFELALGVVLLALWFRRRRRPHLDRLADAKLAKPEPAWQRHVATMGYAGAFVAGGLVQTWPVMIAAGVDITRLDLGAGASLFWMLAFALATTAGIVVLEVLAWRSPSSAADRLRRIRTYVDLHRDAVINWLYLLAGFWLFFRGLLGLV